MSKRSSDGSNVLGGFVVAVFVLVAIVPKPVWIFLGVVVGLALLTWLICAIVVSRQKRRAEAEERALLERAEEAAAAKREGAERDRKEKQHRVLTLGKDNTARVESALTAVQRVAASEAARAGWLGDVDFAPDITAITVDFEKAHALRGVADKLSALAKPSADDRRILAEARTTAVNIERAAIERVDLICKCAKEALLIDRSLRSEREDVRVAERRAELHATLSAMLYGIEATPQSPPADSAADAVLARVQAYREVKNQIHLARDAGAR